MQIENEMATFRTETILGIRYHKNVKKFNRRKQKFVKNKNFESYEKTFEKIRSFKFIEKTRLGNNLPRHSRNRKD